MVEKLIEQSEAVQILREQLANGKSKQERPPKQVWMSDRIFVAYTEETFRTRMNVLKKEYK